MAVVKRPLQYRYRRTLAALGVGAVACALLPAITPGGVAAAQQPAPKCQAETFPPAGSPRNLPAGKKPTPYGIPFTASLAGGYLEVDNSTTSITLGAPVNPVTGDGTITANACGLVYLPNESGAITGNPYGAPGLDNGNNQYNNNFQFHNPINVALSITGLPPGTVPLLAGYGVADGSLGAVFVKTAAANGGINVDFIGTSKATAIVNPLALADLLAPTGTLLPTILTDLGPLGSQVQSLITQIIDVNSTSGGECTLALGDLADTGVTVANAGDLDVNSSGVSPVTGLSYKDETTPATLTTGTSRAPDGTTMTGEPVTGPITAAQAKLVSVDFPVSKIDPNMPPAPDAPGAETTAPDKLCTPTFAGLFNDLLGLPSPAGKNTFTAPGTFAINLTS